MTMTENEMTQDDQARSAAGPSHRTHDEPTSQAAGAVGTGADLPTLLVEQIEFHYRQFMRPRLEGMTDEEYFFDPTGSGAAWSVHPRVAEGQDPPATMQAGAGEMVIDFEVPEPVPAPFTTIAWRLGHVIVGVLAARSTSHFDGPPADYFSWEYATTADDALAQLDREYERWISGVRSWSAEDLLVPVGPAEGPWAESSRATLVAHINRELIHHLAEVALLRDLYAHRG